MEDQEESISSSCGEKPRPEKNKRRRTTLFSILLNLSGYTPPLSHFFLLGLRVVCPMFKSYIQVCKGVEPSSEIGLQVASAVQV